METKIDDIVNLLKEYQDVFFLLLKILERNCRGNGRDEYRTHSRRKDNKKLPYNLSHKNKSIVQKEIEGMVQACIICPIEKEEWASPMVVQPNKHDPKKITIYVDLRGLNKLTVTDPFLVPFIDEINNEVICHECYSFTHEFSGYN